MNNHLLLGPKQPSNRGPKGAPPHQKYRLVRARAEDIIKAREFFRWSDHHAAKELRIRSAREYAEAYDLLKDNGRSIVERGDWSGVEAAIYAKFPGYWGAPKFREILREFGDPRAKAEYPVPTPTVEISDKVEKTLPEATWDPIEDGRKMVDELKEAEGGAENRDFAASRLSLSLAQLYNRINATPRRVVTWLDAAGRFRFPRWQFGVNGMLPGIEGCLAELSDPTDDWAVMRFFLTPAESAGEKSPLDLLRQSKVQEAITLARQTRHE